MHFSRVKDRTMNKSGTFAVLMGFCLAFLTCLFFKPKFHLHKEISVVIQLSEFSEAWQKVQVHPDM